MQNYKKNEDIVKKISLIDNIIKNISTLKTFKEGIKSQCSNLYIIYYDKIKSLEVLNDISIYNKISIIKKLNEVKNYIKMENKYGA